jgi:hypothetical protein
MSAAPHQLEQNVSRQAARLRDIGRHAVGEAQDALLRRGGPFELPVDEALKMLGDLAGHLGEDRGLAGEVVEEGGRRHVRQVGDLRHGGGLVAVLQEELAGGLRDALA